MIVSVGLGVMAGVGRTSVKAICLPADGDVVVVPGSGRMGWSSLDAAIYLAGWLDLALSTIHSWLRVVEYFVIHRFTSGDSGRSITIVLKMEAS